jgi:hypothetical protein
LVHASGQLPDAAQHRGADARGGGGNVGAGGLSERLDKRCARLAPRRFAAPQPQIAVYDKRPADGGEIAAASSSRQTTRRRIIDLARCAMGDYVHRVEPSPVSAPLQSAAPRAVPIEDDRANLRPQVAEDGLEIGDGGIDEENFGRTGHVKILSLAIDRARG